jgi:hypothetical protein
MIRSGDFDVVYYPQLAIGDPQTLTILALICDHIWLPGVHLPSDVVPVSEIQERLRGMEAYERNPAKKMMWRTLHDFAEPRRILKDVFILTGEYGYPGKTEPEAQELAQAVERAYFGPPPPGFEPTIEHGFAIGLEGRSNSIAGPGIFTYPANAIVLALKKGLPLVTDNPDMPVPLAPAGSMHEAHALAFALAVEAVTLVLPPIKAAHPERILEARRGLKDELMPFRARMFELAAELRKAIESQAPDSDLQREARFLVETQVLPALQLLKARLEDRRGRWTEWLVDLTMAAPEIAHYFSSTDPTTAIGKSIGRLMDIVNKIRGTERQQTKEARAMGLTFLLKLPDKLPAK